MALHSKTSLGKRKQKQVEGHSFASVLKVNETRFDTDLRTNIEAETQKEHSVSLGTYPHPFLANHNSAISSVSPGTAKLK